MKKFLLLASACVASTYWMSCNNDANYTAKVPDSGDFHTVAWKDARAMKATGKIFVNGKFIMVNEPYQGIHLIDNTNPAAPKNTSFLSAPGNVDMAMKDDILYIDNYDDLVAFNTKTSEQKRIKGAFKSLRDAEGQVFAFNSGTSDPLGMSRGTFNAVAKGGPSNSSATNTNGGPGVGGSMSRFAVVGNYLYVIDGMEMKVFDITHAYNPIAVSTVKMDFTVETIFPYGDKLFIGGTQGMFVYDATDPKNPTQLSQFQHVVACDPVVVEGEYAYVTVRGGTPCRGSLNELMVLDIKDITNPVLVKNYPMNNPHGLSVEGNMLYLCDGNQGLKSFDITDKSNIAPVFTDHSMKTYDVISDPNSASLIVVGKDGLYQFDRTNPKELKMLRDRKSVV